AGDLLAAGKLAGDPQGLLLQAEREIAATLDQLAAYAQSSTDPAAAAYRSPLFEASQQLLRLSHARGKLIASGREQLIDEVLQAREALQRTAERIQQLPLLGVLETQHSAANDFAALLDLQTEQTQQEATDKGEALRRELDSLLARYPRELDRTRELIAKRSALTSTTEQRLAAVQQALAELEPAVRAEHGRIQREVRLVQGGIIALILLIALGIDRLQRQLTRTLGALVPSLSAWAQGDFTDEVQIHSRLAELGEMETSLNRLRSYLLELVRTLRQQAEDVAGSSRSLDGMSDELQRSARRQADNTAQIRDSLGELEATIQQVAGGAGEAASAGRNAAQAVGEGQQVIAESLGGLHALVGEVQDNAQAIERLSEETSAIGKVLTVIRAIAEQTNLLALNAAIEAARAGSHGRGFAVVADEVRSLAQRTTGATEEIQQLIAHLQGAAEQSLQAMREQVEHAERTAQLAQTADGALEGIVRTIADIGRMAEQIADATAQQSAAVSEIRRHSEHIHELGDTNLAHISQGRERSAQMLRLGNQLQDATRAFRF
ncbi:MAG TPA: chemotaxis protein, partial [Pseudomonas sp.]|uniref:methyl-accepting chemotaxis protein n=1 Tax=Stutzerimonas balearica TaxID=74829 RepID=UPI000EB9564B|nr:chemotaxis protein [Pseudomonas sp.]